MGDAVASRRYRWRGAVSVLANRNFAPLWIGRGLINLSITTRNIALMKLIYDQTDSAGGVGILIFTDVFSTVVITPVAGVIADRFDRKRLLIGIDVLRTVLALLFLWAQSALAIYAINFALAAVTMLYFPARSALVPDLVEKDQLLDANALDNSLSTLMMIVGPLLGGLMVDWFSPQATFVLSAALYLLTALGTLLVRTPPPSILRGEASLRAVYEEFVAGVRYARVNPVVPTLTIIYFVLLAGLGLGISLDVVFAEQVLANGSLSTATAYSYMMSAAAAGMFVGSLAVSYLGRRLGKKQVLLIGLGMMSVDSLVLAFARIPPVALAAKFARGFGNGLSMSLWPTLLQENVESHNLGRAFSLFLGVVSIPPALTVYLGGWLADHTSIQLVYGLTGAWVLLAAIGSRFLPGYRTIPTHKDQ